MTGKITAVAKKAFLALLLVFASRAGARGQQAPFELGLGWAGVLPHAASSYGGGVAVQPTDSGAYFASFRWIFRPHHGLEFRFGRTRDSEIFLVNGNRFRILTTAAEWGGSYVLRPLPGSKLQPFLSAGAGALRLTVRNTYINGIQSDLGASGQTALAFSYGGGLDYALWRALALRVEYRGLLFRQPNFGLQQFFTGARTHLAEPAVGLVVRF
jgi:hypothetical protein